MSKNLEVYQLCLAEVYPFNEIELDFFKDKLDFKYVSANRYINWSYDLIKEYEPLWDWDVLDSNSSVFDKVTLGLLFPERVALPQCTCFRMEDFCEYAECLVNIKRLSFNSSLYQQYGDIYIKLDMLCGTRLIDQEMLVEVLVNNQASTIEQLIAATFKKC
ncbi:hypothetical protein [Allomuricauda sp. ARW1Y1]|jgi:hypothetical protein|uniref:hypothetical protein n=1 Tax=Allomuricauda sp. ARW1Y1 TaxID=2663843 RepID=UPI0015CD2DA7|nr:hypothetical protein [Muricauda sp. ARW1Y1]NYJ26629.1 hypothetical protein [Muricauda sp. ARW1Y1]